MRQADRTDAPPLRTLLTRDSLVNLFLDGCLADEEVVRQACIRALPCFGPDAVPLIQARIPQVHSSFRPRFREIADQAGSRSQPAHDLPERIMRALSRCVIASCEELVAGAAAFLRQVPGSGGTDYVIAEAYGIQSDTQTCRQLLKSVASLLPPSSMSRSRLEAMAASKKSTIRKAAFAALLAQET